jgi:hypothetical protein
MEFIGFAFLPVLSRVKVMRDYTVNSFFLQGNHFENSDFLGYYIVYNADPPKQQQTSKAHCIWLQWKQLNLGGPDHVISNCATAVFRS